MDSIKEIKEIKEGLKSLLDRLEKLEKASCTPCEPLKKPFQVELPRKHDILYYIAGDENKVYMTDFYDFEYFKNRFLNGYYFETKEEAEQHLKEQRLLFKIKKWAEIHNEGWEPDWSNDDEEKYFITCFDCESIELSWEISWGMINFTKLPYFKTSEIVQACIGEFGDEIKEVLC